MLGFFGSEIKENLHRGKVGLYVIYLWFFRLFISINFLIPQSSLCMPASQISAYIISFQGFISSRPSPSIEMH